ncbi:MAG TPA: hypothetical protein VGK74_28870 [Symbiobacteriaceae bacterium]|jgi:hypothetical protein
MKRAILVGLTAVLALAGVALWTLSRPRSMIDWMDFVRLDGITYVANHLDQGRPLTLADLGPHYGTVRFRVSDNVSDPEYRVKDGDAAFLAPGTKLHAVNGYNPRFRLAANWGDQVTLYEAGTNPKAKTGADLLDLADKVTRISIGSPEDGHLLAAVTDAGQVQNLVATVLSTPVFPPGQRGGSATSGVDLCFLTFHFMDGTASTRAYWYDTGVLQAGPSLQMSEGFRTVILETVKPGR